VVTGDLKREHTVRFDMPVHPHPVTAAPTESEQRFGPFVN
jgi:hypothetical protein